MCTKTLDHWGLKDKGVILIDEDEDNDFSPVFKIDGKKFTPEDLGQLAKGYAAQERSLLLSMK